MSLGPEQREIIENNFGFLFALRGALKGAVESLPTLRTLDYGAGALPQLYGSFAVLHPREKVTAFDPHVEWSSSGFDTSSHRFTRWVDSEPKEGFDLIVCHFSIHHMDKAPERVIAGLGRYNPRFVAIAEYDYTTVSEAEFVRTFVAAAERQELREFFNGDTSVCYQLHSRYSQDDYQTAMLNQGLDIVAKGKGHGVAAYKFFIVGEWDRSCRGRIKFVSRQSVEL